MGFLLLRLGILLVNFFSNPVLKRSEESFSEKVSILIPARNEAENLPQTLDRLAELTHQNLEIIVLDDQSSDGTAQVVREFAKIHPFLDLQVVEGEALPAGWLGKNRACFRLAERATGDYLLFLDADVLLSPRAVQSALAEMKAKKLDLLSLFPTQIMRSWGEKLTVPLMHWILLSLLPLRLVYFSKNPSFSAANGQFMLFRADAYRKFQWHERMRLEVVEDIAIMKGLKGEGLKGEVLLGGFEVACRMYTSFREGVNGFSKNLLAGFGGSMVGLLFFLFLAVFGYIFLIVDFPTWGEIPLWVLATLLIFVYKLILANLASQCSQEAVYLHPLQMASLVWIALQSIYRKITKSNTWKGRNVNLS
ncbi:MAG: glycosyltransferase family 2 protein [Bacteroidia bacterium]|nr:glycosyltransferase family 2 protein [Bacteroidia bacterium]